MATDLYELLGPPSPELCRRLVFLLGLSAQDDMEQAESNRPQADAA